MGPEAEPLKLEEFLTRVRFLPNVKLESTLSRLQSLESGVANRSDSPRPTPGAAAPTEDERIQRILAGCPLLRKLIDRPLETGHLIHTERLILRHTFGHLGLEGERFIHHVIARCDNYSPEVTQRWLDRLDHERGAFGCARIQEWLSEVYGDTTCNCSCIRGPYRSPVFLAKSVEKPRKTRVAKSGPELATACAAQEWQGIHDDLFGEEPPCPVST